MKKTIFAFIIFYVALPLSAFTIHSNSFDTLTKELWVNYSTVVTNDSDDSVEITIIKKPIVLPDTWEASICFGYECLSPLDDTAMTVIAPHDSSVLDLTVGILSDTVTAISTPVIAIEISDNNSPKNIKKLIFTMSNQETPPLGIISLKTEREKVKNGDAESVIVWENMFYNTSSEEKSFYIAKSNVMVPDGWDVSLCVNADCQSPMVDTVFIDKLPPNDSVSIEFNISTGSEPGTAYGMLEVGSVDLPLEKKFTVFGVQTEGTSIRRFSRSPKGSVPAVHSLNLTSNSLRFLSKLKGIVSFSLIDAQGRQLITQQNVLLTVDERVNIPIQKIVRPGLYTLLVNIENQQQTYSVILMK